ncbi:hypothetical protein PGUG_00290 [Meyerozyma guilliermondii ATCC 6260]|uniref:Structural maintenance of chromosomes protein n=1 Tax=Meyerozyma guilliermondii (strain ATCC 6260 / CBS 566 / DSM 6381 / JCM 1539 / NBRC 10279 / NRRL Y-324) TaxID=294746 RepID=A5DAI5_PICGU|nr:uncharacterized protein PGUG_00290 [Meyerozyma guilliermondii ATCC 6260]EDK36192.2 hypothetical protein PGUG_00290 [Meyerozyma guilliermondii ATCC 6260]
MVEPYAPRRSAQTPTTPDQIGYPPIHRTQIQINATRRRAQNTSFTMGRLVGLELYNFKSYRGTCKVGFGDSFFTSIIGPNGAGKSNMMDAISFVLGVNSSQLRSRNLQDLIYRGRIGGDSAADTSFEHSNPTSAYVKAIYEKDDGSQLELKRTIGSSGNGDYKINNKNVTAYQYSMVLKEENILIKARNFLVFQGDVEQIASQSPRDLAQLIETISGSGELKPEYDKLKDEYDAAHEFTTQVFSHKKTLNSESRQYKEQLAEKETFETKLQERVDITKLLHLYKLYHNEQKHAQISSEIGSKTEEIAKLESQIEEKKELYDKLVSAQAKDVLRQKKFSSQIASLVKNIESERKNLIPIDASKRSLMAKVNQLKSKQKELTSEMTSRKKAVTNLEKQLKDSERLYKEFQDKISSASNIKVSPQCQQDYESLRAEYLASGGAQLEEKLSLVHNDQEALEVTLTNLRRQLKTAESRKEKLEITIETELSYKRDEIASRISDVQGDISSAEVSRSKLISQKEELSRQELDLNSKLRDVLLKLDELSSRRRESNKQKALRENVAMLKRHFPKGAIRGQLYDLVRPTNQKYEEALSTTLGRNFDSIVVETATIAHKCIEILKERRSGVATFIPLDSVTSDPINLSHLRSLHPSARPGIDIVEYDDPELEQAIRYVVEDTIVVDDINLARSLKWGGGSSLKNKLVTLDGSVISKSGIMSGGRQKERSSSFVQWDKNEWNKLSQVKEELAVKLASLSEQRPKEMEINDLAEKVIALEDNIQLLTGQREAIERAIQDKKSEIEYQDKLIADVNTSIEEKMQLKQEIEEEINSCEEEVTSLQNKIYDGFCKKYSFANGITDYEDKYGSALRSRAKERMQYSKAISTLKNKLEFDQESVEETQNRLDDLAERILKIEGQIVEKLDEKSLKESDVDKLEAELEVLQSEKDQFDTQVASKTKAAEEIDSQITDIKDELASESRAVAGMEESLLNVDMERISVLKSCKIDGINVPLKDGLLETFEIDETMDHISDHIYSIEVDYDLLQKRLRDNYSYKVEAEMAAKIESITEELEQLAPNAKATERLKEVEKKLKSYDRDHTKARQAENKAYEKFKKVTENRLRMFMTTFNHLAEKIDFIYKELTRSSSSPFGGVASLTLEDEEEPYNAGVKYHAMPPSKRFRDMDLLSGGEKTMAALALLFAIHSYQPSPFFVLDEVDAALDVANVNRIATYIKNHAGPNFQFIVISLKNTLFEKSDALVGIYREQQGQ